MAVKSTFNSSQNDVFGNMSDDDDDDDINFNLDGSGFGSEDDEEEIQQTTNQQSSSSMSDDLFDDDLPASDEDADPYTDPNDIFNQMSDDDDNEDVDDDEEIQEPEPPAPAPQPAPSPKKPVARHRGRPRKTQKPEPVAPQHAQMPTPQHAPSPQSQQPDDYFNNNTDGNDDMQSMQVIDDYQQPDDAAYYQNQQQTMTTDDDNMQSYDYNQQYDIAQQSQQQAQPNNNTAYMQAQQQQYAQQDNNPFMQDAQQNQQSQVQHQPSHAQAPAPKPFAAPQEPVPSWHGETPNPNMIQRIIAVSDSIRNDLSSDEKNAVRAVMNAKTISGDDMADLTYAVLTARKSTMTALEELLTARNKDIASRVFYLLRLNDDDLQTIYNIGIAFDAQQDTMSGNSLDHYAISEQANQAVSTLSDNSIDLLQAVYNIYNKSKALMNG